MRTVTEIYEEMRDHVAAETGMAPRGDCEMAVRLYAAAAQICGLYVQNEWTRRQCFPQTAQGEHLDYHATLRGLSRSPAAKAQGTLRFFLTQALPSDLAIPAGTVCMTAGLVRFETAHTAILRAGDLWVEVSAQALEPGIQGNVASGAVRSMAVAPMGVSSCTNPAPFVGGAEEEDDDKLRTRILETFRRMPNGTNAAYYEREALSFSAVAAVNVLARSRGRGTVDVVIATAQGQPDQALLQQVEEHLQAAREIAVDVKTLPPTQVAVPVSVRIRAEEGKDLSIVATQVEDQITSYFNGSLLGQSILRARLGQLIYQVAGVENFKLLAPLDDVAVQPGQLPVLREVAVEEMV